MKKAVWSGLTAFVGVLALASSVSAQTTGNINVQVNVNARAKLSIGGTGTITFADVDPDVVGTFNSGPIALDVKARTPFNAPVSLTVQANGDFANGSATIDLSTLQFTVVGAGFQAGASDKDNPVTVGSWTGSGDHTGTHTYTLPNSWSYATGTYSVQLNYTLVTP